MTLSRKTSQFVTTELVVLFKYRGWGQTIGITLVGVGQELADFHRDLILGMILGYVLGIKI